MGVVAYEAARHIARSKMVISLRQNIVKNQQAQLRPNTKTASLSSRHPKERRTFFQQKGEQKLGRGEHKKTILYKY